MAEELKTLKEKSEGLKKFQGGLTVNFKQDQPKPQTDELWDDPLPFDNYSSLPKFSTEALSGIGREMVETIAEVNQVDVDLPASIYLSVLATCVSKKAMVSLGSHTEPLKRNSERIPLSLLRG